MDYYHLGFQIPMLNVRQELTPLADSEQIADQKTFFGDRYGHYRSCGEQDVLKPQPTPLSAWFYSIKRKLLQLLPSKRELQAVQ